MILDTLDVPIVLAPLAGGPSTPALCAAVCEAGGLGFLAAGYRSPDELAGVLAQTRAATARGFGVNVFVPGERPAEPATYAPFVERLRAAGLEPGEPRFDDDGWEAKLALLCDEPPAVVSFTFGCPSHEVIARIRSTGSEAWVTVTSADEAHEAASAGADALVVQGGEAGGHRGSFVDRPDLPVTALLPLLQLVRAAVDRPLVAAGGIATGAAVAAVLSAGAAAAQAGTAFLRCPEAGTSDVHRRALASGGETALTRAFTGRLARGIRNRWMDEHGAAAPIAYPELHHATAPTRAAARARGDDGAVNLWAGEAHALAQERPAADVVRSLAAGAPGALDGAGGRRRR